MFKRILILAAIVAMLANGTVVFASSEPHITNLRLSQTTFSPDEGEDVTIRFNVYADADITVKIKDGGQTVRTFSNYSEDFYNDDDTHELTWNGEDDDEDIVDSGEYTVFVQAVNSAGTSTDTVTVNVLNRNDDYYDNNDDYDYDYDYSDDEDIIQDLRLNPSGSWDPSDKSLSISFDLTHSVDSLVIEAKKGSKTVELLDRDDVSRKDNFTKTWNGKDNNGHYVAGGTWTIRVMADDDTDTKTINVRDNGGDDHEAQIKKAVLTKGSFDPDKREVSDVIFRTDADAYVDVDIYEGTSSKVINLVHNLSTNKNQWYFVEWDGKDRNDRIVDEGSNYYFVVTTNSKNNDERYDKETLSVSVRSDDYDNDVAYVVKDSVSPVIFDRDESDDIKIRYCLENTDADVYMAVYKGESTSGTLVKILMNYNYRDEGCDTVTWNAKDSSGRSLSSDSVYTYKIVSRNYHGVIDTATGRFVVGKTSLDDDDDDDNDYNYDCEDSDYRDVDNLKNAQMCEAIIWTTENGIFDGYPDRTFKPYAYINRAEVLKVVLEAFDVDLLGGNGTNLGFKDVDPYAWYIRYVRTAKQYGMISGYEDGTARLDQYINRAEILKIVLEASSEFITGYQIPVANDADYTDVDYKSWYSKYIGASYTYGLFDDTDNGTLQRHLYPDRPVQRVELALMFYKLHLAGLMD